MNKIKAFMWKHPMWPMVFPAALLIYFVYYSLAWNIWVSVSDWQGGDLVASYGWGGFQWYEKMFTSETFWTSFGNTILLFLIIPICLIIGLGLAILMDQGLKGTAVFRSLILLPFALSYVVTGTIWAWMYNPKNGIINSILKMFGVDTSNLLWTAGKSTMMLCIIIALVWQFSGYVALLLFAGIRSVPQNVINAAKLDGAYSPRIYLKLIIPQLKGAVVSSVTVILMFALRSFDFIYQLYGMYNTTTYTLPVMMYVESFQKNNYAYGAAIATFLLALVLVIMLPFTYFTSRKKTR